MEPTKDIHYKNKFYSQTEVELAKKELAEETVRHEEKDEREVPETITVSITESEKICLVRLLAFACYEGYGMVERYMVDDVYAEDIFEKLGITQDFYEENTEYL